MKKITLAALAESLLANKTINEKQLDDIKKKRISTKKSFHELLIETGYIDETDLLHIESELFDIPIFDPKKESVDQSASKLISDKLVKSYCVFPLRKENGILVLAISDPTNIIALDDLNIVINMPIKTVLGKKPDILNLIDKHYHPDDTFYDILHSVIIAEDGDDENGRLGEDIFDLKDSKQKSSVAVRLINLLLKDAVKNKASDIHIEPQDKFISIRYRLDGDLKNMMKLPLVISSALVARIKILSKLDIAEKHKPQDGRVSILINDRKIDLRISTMPTFYGEKVVVRLLDPEEAKIHLDTLGMHEQEKYAFTEFIKAKQGMILVTGPTGSGKTSTLYAALNFMKNEPKNIVTIEDPIEYLIDGINQMQVNQARKITFATGLRNILRQDPNIILVGEIRDKEAADIAFRSALTGHLVLSTLHTSGVIPSIARLFDLGMDPYVVSSSLIAIVSQRLIKLICPHCKEERRPDIKAFDTFRMYIEKAEIVKFYAGKGCQSCNFTGFSGRTAVFEILNVNDKIKNLISRRAPEDEILKEAKANGFKSLAELAIEKVAKGLTTLEEVAACIYLTSDDGREADYNDTQRHRISFLPPHDLNFFNHSHEGAIDNLHS